MHDCISKSSCEPGFATTQGKNQGTYADRSAEILRTNKRVLVSQQDPLKKIIYQDGAYGYYSVAFLDDSDKSINVCVSSQIGCAEACAFCATGDQRLIKNLGAHQIAEEICDGVGIFDEKDRKILYIIMEGMGEASHNLENVFLGLRLAYSKLGGQFERIAFRISTIGNVGLVDQYIRFIEENKSQMPNVEFQFQISLHSPFDSERRQLIPKNSSRYSIDEIFSAFSRLAQYLDSKIKCNYLLLNLPSGETNYSQAHLDQLIALVNPEMIRLKLTMYSDTGKGFSSPELSEYERISGYLNKHGISTKIRHLLGGDLDAACGMLKY